MTSAKERIAKIRAQVDKALGRAKKMSEEARALERNVKTKERSEDRTKDTRRKILIGSMNLEKAARYEDHRIRQLEELGSYLTRESDRILFDLRPLQQNLEIDKSAENVEVNEQTEESARQSARLQFVR